MSLLSSIPLIPLLLYVALGGAYLVIFPAITFLYLKNRWYVASSIERLLMYFLVFLFFPGLLLLSPLLNFRPQPRQIS
ncbi:MAG: NAD(P)H-quinone oxidoreductase subunit L [Cyanobacteria bacterium CRU_2_1]|nr:NAD(P)H-quinone oxidoreductase subunit L [Cyanobacteria bacterium RU_5_0]NJR59781.1 NAD(P)H-quinone oxidoreductase subunit L [Cyanobacteria bacterium CRU_2_1]